MRSRIGGSSLILCDLTQACAATNGDVSTYIDTKSAYLLRRTRHRHVVIVPGERDTCTVDGRRRLYTVAAPLVPGYKPCRFILRFDKVAAILERESPHVIEVACPYVLPWVALSRRRRCRTAVVGFHHHDSPAAHFHPALRRVAPKPVVRLAERLGMGYAGAVYARFDATIVASEASAVTLERSGVPNVVQISLGVNAAWDRTFERLVHLYERLTPAPGRFPGPAASALNPHYS